MANNNNRNAGAAAGPAAADGDEPNWRVLVGAGAVLGAGAGLVAWRLAPAKTTEDAQ